VLWEVGGVGDLFSRPEILKRLKRAERQVTQWSRSCIDTAAIGMHGEVQSGPSLPTLGLFLFATGNRTGGRFPPMGNPVIVTDRPTWRRSPWP
jgi:hypothetical protein